MIDHVQTRNLIGNVQIEYGNNVYNNILFNLFGSQDDCEQRASTEVIKNSGV